MAVIYVAERIWTLTAKIITFFDKRSAKRKVLEDKRAKCAPPKGRAKLPNAVGGPLGQIAAGTLALPSRSILARNAAAFARVKP